MEHKIPITIEHVEELAVEIKRIKPEPKPLPELSVDDKAQVIVDALELALPHMIACKRAKMKADAEYVAAVAATADLQDRLRNLRIDINGNRV